MKKPRVFKPGCLFTQRQTLARRISAGILRSNEAGVQAGSLVDPNQTRAPQSSA